MSINKRQRQLMEATGIALRAPDTHPFQVAIVSSVGITYSLTPDFDAYIVGLLHDSLEDGYATGEELMTHFDNNICAAVTHITRGDGEKYWDYIARVKGLTAPATALGPLVRKVKLADARINLQRCVTSFGYDSLAERYKRVIKELS